MSKPPVHHDAAEIEVHVAPDKRHAELIATLKNGDALAIRTNIIVLKALARRINEKM
jgi:hypothetical protein